MNHFSRHPAGSWLGACVVCGSHEIDRDEVDHGGVLGLGECRRCRHRWTEGPFAPGEVASGSTPRQSVRVGSESAAVAA